MLINSLGMLLNQMKDFHSKKEHYWLVINLNGTWHFESDAEDGEEYIICSTEVERIYKFFKSLELAYANEVELWMWVVEIINIMVDDFYYDHTGEHIHMDLLKGIKA